VSVVEPLGPETCPAALTRRRSMTEVTMFETSYRINDPNVVSEQFDAEFVVLNLLTGTYCSFRTLTQISPAEPCTARHSRHSAE